MTAPLPALSAPVAEEATIVPAGKLEPGMVIGGDTPAITTLTPARPPTALLLPPATAPAAVSWSGVPAVVPAKPPMEVLLPVAGTDGPAVACARWISPRLTPAKPPTRLSPSAATAPAAVDAVMVAKFRPTKPPTVLVSAVLVIVPNACEPVIVLAPSAPNAPTKPPMMLLP